MVDVGKYASPTDFCGIFFGCSCFGGEWPNKKEARKKEEKIQQLNKAPLKPSFFLTWQPGRNDKQLKGGKKSSQKA